MASIWKSGQVTAGAHVLAFEEAVAKKIGVRHAVAVSSCTSGLIMASARDHRGGHRAGVCFRGDRAFGYLEQGDPRILRLGAGYVYPRFPKD
jgi:hypothetical protein